MKAKLTKFGVGLALAAMLTTVANANVFKWVPDNSLTLQPTSGTLDYTGGILTSFSWSYDGFAGPDTSFIGSITVLGDGNLHLTGSSSGVGGPTTDWYALNLGGADENYGNVHTGTSHPAGPIFGNWEAASTPDGGMTVALLGGALMGLAALRRKLLC